MDGGRAGSGGRVGAVLARRCARRDGRGAALVRFLSDAPSFRRSALESSSATSTLPYFFTPDALSRGLSQILILLICRALSLFLREPHIQCLQGRQVTRVFQSFMVL